MAQFNFEAIGTSWHIDIYQNLSKDTESLLLSSIKNRIEIFDKNYSRFRSDSFVTQMSKQAGTFLLPEDAKTMLFLYRNLYVLTGGLFTPLVGNILSDAGYDANYSLKQNGDLKIAPSWEEVIDYQYPNIHIKKPAILDFGAAGKGYLIDLLAKVIEESGIFEYCIDAGGDILHKNKTPIRVGLENPENTKQVIGVYSLGNGSICGSAHNRRAWGDFSHIINPKTLSSPRDITAVWVIAKTALIADALATCLFFVEASTFVFAYDFEYLLVRSDHSIEKSDNFSADFSAEMFVSLEKEL